MNSATPHSADVVLVTASRLPKPDRETHLLANELQRQGIRTAVLPWDHPFDWEQVSLTVIRTPWDYVRRLDEFLSWTRQVGAVSRLVNPAEVIAWNSNKRYLLDLADAGVPIVPTRFIERGDHAAVVDALARETSAEVVIKPAVSSGAIGAFRGKATDEAASEHLRRLAADGDVIVQPFISSVLAAGESSLVYFGGVYSHAIRKLPKEGDYRVQDQHGGTVHSHEPGDSEREVAAAALAAAPETTVYARVDLVHGEEGPAVMELEVIEPELFLPLTPTGTGHFAAQIRRLLDSA